VTVSIRDVAEKAGVSRGTVSKVLNERDGGQIAPATRERVRRAVSELGYHPSAVARGLARKPMNTLGIVFAKTNTYFTTSPFFAAVLDGVLEVTTRQGQNTTLFTGQPWSDARRSIPILRDGRSDGLLVISPPPGSDVVPALLGSGVPFVLVDEQHDDPAVSSVDIDNVAAARGLVEYLIGLGHRRIAMLCGYASVGSVALRLEGCRRALAAAGIDFDLSLVLPGAYVEQSGYERAHLLLRRPAAERPTVLFCGNDQIALGALIALEERGVRVPDDVSVVGFDDIPAAATARPGLTTVRQPMRRLGARAAEVLLAHIRRELPPGHKEILPTELVVRRSAAAPASSLAAGGTL
jgi:LacI family transcriptional regulator